MSDKKFWETSFKKITGKLRQSRVPTNPLDSLRVATLEKGWVMTDKITVKTAYRFPFDIWVQDNMYHIKNFSPAGTEYHVYQDIQDVIDHLERVK